MEARFHYAYVYVVKLKLDCKDTKENVNMPKCAVSPQMILNSERLGAIHYTIKWSQLEINYSLTY